MTTTYKGQLLNGNTVTYDGPVEDNKDDAEMDIGVALADSYQADSYRVIDQNNNVIESGPLS